jgi:hypothetical protein
MRSYLEMARQVLASAQGCGKAECANESLEAVLKGRAIELWSNGECFWLVADEEDAEKLAERRGAVYTAPEVQHLVTVRDPAIVREIHVWKRATNAIIRGVHRE